MTRPSTWDLSPAQLAAEGDRQRDRLIRGVLESAEKPLTSSEILAALVGWPCTSRQVRESCTRLGYREAPDESGEPRWTR